MWTIILTIYLIIGVVVCLSGAQLSPVRYNQSIYILVTILWLPLLVFLALGGRGSNDKPNE